MIVGAWGGYQPATRETGNQISIEARDGGVVLNGQFIGMQSHPFAGRVFTCPRCDKPCYRLYDVGGWACRRCHRLKYLCRSRGRTIPGYSTLRYLRRRAGLVETPFAPIPHRSPHAWKYWRLVAQIRKLEAGMIEHTRQSVNDALARRLSKGTAAKP